ncbi:MAG: hypothetical protein HZA28_00215, partial [Candidatus Omnitrophica bacterium]|nr:hypothetical protein [Candidatus Omnitrophota bacterium]
MNPPPNKTRRPLLWITLCFGGGILLGAYVPVPVLAAYAAAALCVVLCCLLFHKPRGFL